MEFLKRQLFTLQQQLKQLSASQRMLAGTLVIIAVMTLYWSARYAGNAEMEAVLNTDLSAADVQSISSHLKSQGIPCTIVGQRVNVPADRKDEAFVSLAFAQLLPQNTTNAFDDMVAKSGPFDSNHKHDAMWNLAKQNVLSHYISMFPGVRTAGVLIDPTREHGPNGTMPSAAVTITLRPDVPVERKLAESAADLIVGAVANLTRERVQVLINGNSLRLRNRNDNTLATDDYLGAVQTAEKTYVERIERLLHDIPNVFITVNVAPNNKQVKTQENVYDPKGVISRPAVEDRTTSDDKSGSAAAEPGLKSNTPMDLGDGRAAPEGTSTTTEKTRNENVVKISGKTIETTDNGGAIPATSASVRIPRSHFLQTYKHDRATEQDPDPQTLDAFVTEQFKDLKSSIQKSLGLPSEDVALSCYTDLTPMAAAAPQTASTSFAFLATGHVKEIALGVLALASLLMVSQIVRKNAPAPVIAHREAPRPPQPLPSTEETVGEAVEGGSMLDAVEVDEESVKAQNMLTQVSQMVEENPDAAASLVKRWLNRS